jgi:hypothetical protein
MPTASHSKEHNPEIIEALNKALKYFDAGDCENDGNGHHMSKIGIHYDPKGNGNITCPACTIRLILLKLEKPVRTCVWCDDNGTWNATCGLAWELTNNGSPAENDIKFCPKCGLKIEIQVCKDCHDRGGVYRCTDSSLKPDECGGCGKVGSPEYIDDLNFKEAERNKGFQFDRVEHNIYEQAYYEVWAKNNRSYPGLNGGYTIIQSLISKAIHKDNIIPGLRLKPIPKNEIATERDFRIAATVFQFLGTNGGRYILDEVKIKINELEKKEREENKKIKEEDKKEIRRKGKEND